MVRILGFHCYGLASIPGRGTEILHAVQPKKKKKKKKKRMNDSIRLGRRACQHKADQRGLRRRTPGTTTCSVLVRLGC